MFDTKRHAWQPAWRYALAVYHLPDKPGFGLGCRGLAGDGMLEHIHNYYGPDVDAEGIVRIANAKAAELSRRGVPKKKGLDHILAYLSERGIPMAVASSNTQETIDFLLESSGIRHYFLAADSGMFIEHPKPAPDIFLSVARKMGVEPTRTLVLEDSVSGIQAAHAGGFIPVMVPDLMQPPAELRPLCRAVCKDLDEARELIDAGEYD